MELKNESNYLKFCWFVLVWTLFVVLWGAIVRATGSGAGCGEHWPLCNGEVLPSLSKNKTFIEYGHRITSGGLGIAILFVYFWGRKLRGLPEALLNKINMSSLWIIFFVVIESLIGALLVKKGLVEANDSYFRGVVLSIHFVNTMLLIGVMTRHCFLLRHKQYFSFQTLTSSPKYMAYTVLFIFVSVFGAITALGDTLFPALDLASGMQQDLDPSSHLFIKLRVFHPFSAVILLGALVFEMIQLGSLSRKFKMFFLGCLIFQGVFGGINLYLLAPLWGQVLHLLGADLLWICFCWMMFIALTPERTEQSP